MGVKMQFLALNLVLAVLVCVEQSSSKPAVLEREASSLTEHSNEAERAYDPIEQARQLWSGAKRLQRQLTRPRRKRNAAPSPANHHPNPVIKSDQFPADLNISAPRYILDVFRNLTSNPALQQMTQANTIRSLQMADSVVPKCNEFTFSISAINASEYIIKAELRLFMKEKPFGNQRSYLVVIKRKAKPDEETETNGHPGLNYITSKEIVPTEAGWHIFNLQPFVESWVYAGESLAEITVHVYPSIHSYRKQEDILDCSESPVEFVYTKSSEHEPLLVVHSYDPEVEKIDYQAILENLGENPTNHVAERRKKRSSSETQETLPSCSLFPLNITAGDIPPKRRGEVVLFPLHYDAGICGGQCLSKFPTTQDLKHAQLVHLLLNRGTFNDRHGYTFTQCCAPVKYSSLDVLIRPAPGDSNRSVYINIINNMRILECECLDVVDFESSRR